ncbi:MAG TPA: hypothetical protein VI757_03045 [Bacteroidia bacterium]|nr:hypothetical protein [Bacteroidia bacterium]
MKTKATLILILGLIFSRAQGQNKGYISDLYMSGKWTATCATEIIDRAGWRVCGLCVYPTNPNDSSSWQHADIIELNFLSDSLIITQDGRMTTVSWTRNTDNHSFSFIFNNKPYHFRMFLYGKQKRIIEDSDGMLLVLEKVN